MALPARQADPAPPSPLQVYQRLLDHYGHAGWWPGESAFEVCVGAVLTQNTSWSNVERALARLRASGRLSFRGLRGLPTARIARLIRSSGCYRVKARRLAALLAFLDREYGGQVETMGSEEARALRAKLLGVHGIGPETADSIVLYAAGLPLFVVDAYTRRIFERLGLLGGGEDYDEIQRSFMRLLPRDAALYNDFHAQIVRLGKDCCRKQRPRCERCPLCELCPVGRASLD
jgi:endonuclease III related protein